METLQKYKLIESISFVGAHFMNCILYALVWYKEYVKCFKFVDPNFPSAFIWNKITKCISQDTIVYNLPLFS